jgi:hypothetical protein
MSDDLRTIIAALAHSFADGLLAAIRGASLEEILEVAPSGPRRAGARVIPARSARSAKPARSSTGRLARRSPAQIAKALQEVVALVRTNKGGRRAEQIRQALGMEAKEMPRILKEGVAKKVLKSSGEKRATTYAAR